MSTHGLGKLKKEHTKACTHTGMQTHAQIKRHVRANTHKTSGGRRMPDKASRDGSGATNDEDNFLTAAGG